VGRECPLPTGEGLGRGLCPSQKKVLILDLNMVSFGAFWVAFFTVQLPVLHAKPEFNRYRRIKAVMVSVLREALVTVFASNTKARFSRLDQNVFVYHLKFRSPKSDCDVDNCTSKYYLLSALVC